jgi:hypothetical protein
MNAPTLSALRCGIIALATVLLVHAARPVAAADDATAAARASLERVRALRTERPGDGLLIYYQAAVHAVLGERDAALAELKTLVGRRLGIVPARGTGFDAIWSDPEFQVLRDRLAADEVRTANAPVAFRLNDPRLRARGHRVRFDRPTLFLRQPGAAQDRRHRRARARCATSRDPMTSSTPCSG